jgi:hypothetical protein
MFLTNHARVLVYVARDPSCTCVRNGEKVKRLRRDGQVRHPILDDPAPGGVRAAP